MKRRNFISNLSLAGVVAALAPVSTLKAKSGGARADLIVRS